MTITTIMESSIAGILDGFGRCELNSSDYAALSNYRLTKKMSGNLFSKQICVKVGLLQCLIITAVLSDAILVTFF
uniref:Uncharacterized protein n=1 Tax=Onchocerca volvulus TaxID=6282 RepID=A0A8R1TKN8_ONCVO